MRLTANHNILIYEIEPSQQLTIQQILDRHGVHISPEGIEPLARYSMACPALPTCGLAITESERALPGIIERIRTLLDKLGLQNEHFVIRSTGCPNGCARPYMAELGLVGSAPESYQVWLGGTPNQTRLAQPYTDRMPIHEMESFLEPIFVYFKEERKAGESFGDFCDRVGFDAIREFTVVYESPKLDEQSDTGLVNEVVIPEPSTTLLSGKVRYRIGVRDELYKRVKEAAKEQGKSMTQLTTEALEAYLKGNPDA
jgi:sulfite reductase (ferredoxin)